MHIIQRSVRGGLLRPLRKVGLAAARHWPWPVSVKISGGWHMFVDLRSGIGRGIFAQAEFDPAVFAPLRAALKPGGTFLDVGANVGFYSMLALDVVGSAGAIHAFEIDERPLRCLRKTIACQRIQNLFLHELAVGRVNGTAQVATRPESGHTSIVEQGGNRQVSMVTLDSWWRSWEAPRIQAIKLDIEGAELLALDGAKHLLRVERPVVVCEVDTELEARFGYQQADVVHLLSELQYRVSLLEGAFSPTFVAIPE